MIKSGFKNCLRQFRIKLRFGSVRDIERAIDCHNIVVKECEDINRMYKIITFIIYYIASPSMILCTRLALSKDLDPIIKYPLFLIAFIAGCVFVGMNFLSSLIRRTAHRPRLLLYKYLDRSLTLRHRMKIMAFIEKLCGPDIGFYCLDLFPMNNYEFYLYITNCVKNYILFDQLFKVK